MKKTKTRKKSQSTKYAFVFSVVSMLFSIAMFVGVTYAWFTDTVTSGVTTILAGSWLDVQLVDAENCNIEGKTLHWTDENGTVVTSWNPGGTYNLQPFKIKNNGSLALTYEITITGADNLGTYITWCYRVADNEGDKKLTDKGILSKGADSGLITITANVDNGLPVEYQNFPINSIGIIVKASQANSE